MSKVKVSVGGRVVIPKEIREKLKIESGDEVKISVKDRILVLKPEGIKNPVERLYGSVRTKPEEGPKKVAREWVKKKIEEDL